MVTWSVWVEVHHEGLLLGRLKGMRKVTTEVLPRTGEVVILHGVPSLVRHETAAILDLGYRTMPVVLEVAHDLLDKDGAEIVVYLTVDVPSDIREGMAGVPEWSPAQDFVRRGAAPPAPRA